MFFHLQPFYRKNTTERQKSIIPSLFLFRQSANPPNLLFLGIVWTTSIRFRKTETQKEFNATGTFYEYGWLFWNWHWLGKVCTFICHRLVYINIHSVIIHEFMARMSICLQQIHFECPSKWKIVCWRHNKGFGLFDRYVLSDEQFDMFYTGCIRNVLVKCQTALRTQGV